MEIQNNKPFVPKVSEKRILKLIRQWENKRLYIKPNYKINDLSEDINVNYKYISYVINKNFGMSFSNYMNSLRLKEMEMFIKYLNKGKEINLTLLSKKLGFSSYFQFAHYIKKYYGIAPREYFENIVNKK